MVSRVEAVMNVEELKVFLKEHLVPSRLYKIGGASNHRICMQKSAEGWDVFFSEKKEKVGLLHFKDEASACLSMKNELRKLMEVIYGLTWAPVR